MLDIPNQVDRVWRPGDVVDDRYRLDEPLGRGGHAQVFRALSLATGAPVALKIVGADRLRPNPVRLRRFFREANVMARLTHPSIVRVFDFGQHEDGTAYLAMELLQGRTLGQVMNERRLRGETFTPEEVRNIARAVCAGLAEVHRSGMTHRDLTPANVFMQDSAHGAPVVRLLDFGIALPPDEDRLTSAGVLLGTPSYASPEQVLGRGIDARTDVFAIGLLCFEMLTGAKPYGRTISLEDLMVRVSDEAPRVRSLRPDVDERLDEIVARCLSRHPEARPASAMDLGLALAGLDVPAAPQRTETFVVPPPTPTRSYRRIVLYGMLAIFFGVVLGLTYLASASPELTDRTPRRPRRSHRLPTSPDHLGPTARAPA